MDFQHDDPTARRLGAAVYITKYADDLRESLLGGPLSSSAALDQALEALHCGGDPARFDAAVAELHKALRASGDPFGVNAENRNFTPTGTDAARPDETVYLCPTDGCARFWWPQPGKAVPRCAICNTELRRERL